MDATTSSGRVPGSLGRYQVEAVVGRGGSATVFSAFAPDGRRVAIKLLSPGGGAGARLARFEREEQLLLELSRGAGFVPLLDRGDSPWGPYLVMPFLGRGTLLDRLRRGPLAADEALAIVRELAAALSAAHDRGVVHRDLKPANVLFADDGRPLIADLGIAKHEDASALSRTGEALGTWGYMAPEQARDAKSVGPAADVFSLGVLLHECLSSQQAFPGSLMQVAEAVAEHRIVPLGRLMPVVPPGVEQLVLEAVDPDPARRPPDARAFLLRLPRASPVARPVTARGQRAPLLLAALTLGLGAIGAAAIAWPREALPPPVAKEAASPSPSPPPTPPSVRLQELARWGTGAPHLGMVDHLVATLDGKVVISGGVDGLLVAQDLASGAELARVQAHSGLLSGFELSRDGRLLLTAGREGVRAWEPGTLRAVPVTARVPGATGVVALGDGRILTGGRGEARVWDLGRADPVARLALGEDRDCGAFASPDGRIAVLVREDRLKALDFASGRPLADLALPDPVMHVAFSSDGGLVAACGTQGWLVAWETSGWTEVRRLRAITPERNAAFGHARRLAFVPGARHVLVAGDDETVRRWDLDTGTELAVFQGHCGWVSGLALVPGQPLMISGGNDQTVRLWDLERAVEVRPRTGHAGYVHAVRWKADGRQAISAGHDCAVHTWDTATGREVLVERVRFSVQALDLDGQRTLAGGYGLACWEGEHAEEVAAPRAPLHSAVFVRDEARERLSFLACDQQGAMVLSQRGAVAGPGPELAGRAVVVSRARGQVAFLGTRRVSRLLPGGELATLLELEASAGAFAGEATLVVGTDRGDLHRIELAGGATTTLEAVQRGGISAVATSPDGRLAATAARDGTLCLWELLAPPKELDRLQLDHDEGLALDFSPAGDELLVGTRRGLVLRLAVR